MANQVSSVDVPLSIFGSLDTELSPPDVPEGASPANNDVVYTPGSVQTRPAVNRVFSLPVSALGPITYEKSFVLSSGAIKNLYLTRDDGILWVEDVTNAPGVATQLYASAGATYASSVTASGAEYIALSDGVHGVDFPLQYDGTNLRRVTNDGPGLAPTVTSIALPSSTMATSGAITPGTIATIVSSDPVAIYEGPYVGYVTYYTTITITLTAPTTAPIGTKVVVSGGTNPNLDVTSSILSISSTTTFKVNFYSQTLETGTGGTATFTSGITLQRQNNAVSCTTATAHGLRVGYQSQIQGAGTTVVGGTITSIVLNNEDTPGIATVTMTAVHGLLPGNFVNIAGVSGVTVGTAITNVAFNGNMVTITTSGAHGLSIGSQVNVAATTATWANGEWAVTSVPSTTTFTYAFYSTAAASTAADTGTVSYLWPLANVNPAQNYFTVQTAPTSTTFTITLSYTDGTWTGGTVSFGWDGIFFVTAVPSTTSFQYQQYGPNATTTSVGTVTPYGQISPGLHQLRVSFLYASGYISVPSPPVTFVASGGQYLSVTNILPGPTTYVVGRILQLTGSGGAYFFYIPVPASVNGLTVSTATQINDNTSTSALLDFSDNTLYAATAVSIPGNNLAAQVVLGPCSGFFSYASRLLAWGERNKVQNLLNMGFDGGAVTYVTGISAKSYPAGWTLTTDDNSLSVVNGRLGYATNLTLTPDGATHASIAQSAYLDASNAPVVLPNTKYTFRVWIQASVSTAFGNLFAKLSSSSAGFTSTATINGAAWSTNAAGRYVQADFDTVMPNNIPGDMTLKIYGTLSASYVGSPFAITLDDCELIYTSQPYLDNQARISYAENLEAFDDQTGILGAVDDLSPIRNFGVIRQTLYMVTGTGLHQTQDNDQTEPSGWNVEQVADNCGAFSIASVGRNPQGVGSAGKDWMMWSGPDGAQIFTGGQPRKVSQEIQSLWDAIPAANAYQCWVKNYETAKWCFFGVPSGSTMQVLVLDYRNIDGANIADNPPVHISFTGKMIVSDLTRKWTQWTVPSYCGELMYRNTIAQPQIVFGCKTPANGGNAYTLNAAQYHDDDFGVIPASYTTYFFVGHEQEQGLQVGSHRHIYTMSAAYISGVGNWTLTPYAASLSNPFPVSAQYPLTTAPNFDMDFGINVETTRCAFKIQAVPISPSTDSYFKLQKLVVNMAPAPWAKVRGSSGGAF